MRLHEHQAKQLFVAFGIPIPRGALATTPQEAQQGYETLKRRCAPQGTFACAVKAQVHAGGRGKAGGILLAHSGQEAAARSSQLIGQRLVTRQTGPSGLPVSSVLLEEQLAVSAERYVALTIDRFHARPVVLVSRRGGVEIEDIARAEPEAIVREPFDIMDGLKPAQTSRLACALGCVGEQAEPCQRILRAMWKLVEARDASLVEINPLVTSEDGRLLALDAKVTLDDNACFRQPELAAWRDTNQEDPMELQAVQAGISYVGLSGTIGCLVNGAGLAMATNDIIELFGGEPANFLDVGGGANVEQITRACSIILGDARVRVILVNIFGGIMRCDWIAQGLLNATQQLQVRVPIVVRLEGTNVEEGRALLARAKALNIISVDGLAAAARRVVTLADGAGAGTSRGAGRRRGGSPRGDDEHSG